MSSLIGPYLVFNQLKSHVWCYFEIIEGKAACFVWCDERWSLQTQHHDNLLFYTYSPQDKSYISFVLTPTQNLLKIPVFEYPAGDGQPCMRRVSQVFTLFSSEAGVRWVPSHLMRARAFHVDVEVFSVPVGDVYSAGMLDNMPDLPQREEVVPLHVTQRNTHEVGVDVTRSFARCKGLEFPVSRSLSDAQRSFIVQFINTNGDWPFLGGSRQAHIQAGLALLQGTSHAATAPLTITKYRDPIFLASLLTDSFYPATKKELGFYTTVGHVWCFVNVLLAHGLRLLGFRGKIELPLAPRGYGVSSTEYLLRHAAPAQKRVKQGLSPVEKDVHQIVMSYADDTYMPIFDDYTSSEQDAMIGVLRKMIAGRALVMDLTESLFNSIANLFQSGGELASDYLKASCETILSDLCTVRTTSVTKKLADLRVDADCSGIMQQLSHLTKDIQHVTTRTRVLDALPAPYRALLVKHMEKDTRVIDNMSQSSIFSNSHTAVCDVALFSQMHYGSAV